MNANKCWVRVMDNGRYFINLDGFGRPSAAMLPNEIPQDTPLNKVKGSYKSSEWGLRDTKGLNKTDSAKFAELNVTTFGDFIRLAMNDPNTVSASLATSCGTLRRGVIALANWFKTNAPDYGEGYVVPPIVRLDKVIAEIRLDPEKVSAEHVNTKEVAKAVREYIMDYVFANSATIVNTAVEAQLIAKKEKLAAQLAKVQSELASL